MSSTASSAADAQYVVLIDNSNLWIEGMKFSASASESADTFDRSWRLDFGKLLACICLQEQLREAVLYGSKPPSCDTIWEKAEEKNIKCEIFWRSVHTNAEKQVDGALIDKLTATVVECSTEIRIMQNRKTELEDSIAVSRANVRAFMETIENISETKIQQAEATAVDLQQQQLNDVTRKLAMPKLRFAVIGGDKDYLQSIERALDAGFSLTLYSWRSCCSAAYKKLEEQRLNFQVIWLDGLFDQISLHARITRPPGSFMADVFFLVPLSDGKVDMEKYKKVRTTITNKIADTYYYTVDPERCPATAFEFPQLGHTGMSHEDSVMLNGLLKELAQEDAKIMTHAAWKKWRKSPESVVCEPTKLSGNGYSALCSSDSEDEQDNVPATRNVSSAQTASKGGGGGGGGGGGNYLAETQSNENSWRNPGREHFFKKQAAQQRMHTENARMRRQLCHYREFCSKGLTCNRKHSDAENNFFRTFCDSDGSNCYAVVANRTIDPKRCPKSRCNDKQCNMLHGDQNPLCLVCLKKHRPICQKSDEVKREVFNPKNFSRLEGYIYKTKKRR